MITKNPFENINIKAAKIGLQKVTKGAVRKASRGRPPRPNVSNFLIRLDRGLHAKVRSEATKMDCSNSFVISQALRKYFSNK